MKETLGRVNVLGGSLKPCCKKTMTGFFRDGYCTDCQSDYGNHSVCAIVTEDFLKFTKDNGNDLSTPREEFRFPGLKAGDRWCLCASRWLEAYDRGIKIGVDLEATSLKALEVIPFEALESCAI